MKNPFNRKERRERKVRTRNPQPVIWLFLSTLLLSTLNCWSQTTTVNFFLTNFTGSAMNRQIFLRLRSQGAQGTVGQPTLGIPVTLQPTNGFATTNLFPVTYLLTIDGISSVYVMPVPATTNTVNAWDLVNAGAVMDLPFPTFAAGTNTVFQTNYLNGFPTVTINQTANTNSGGGSGVNVGAGLGITTVTNSSNVVVSLANPMPALNGNALTNLNATNLTGTLQTVQFPASLPAIGGSALTSLSSSALSGALPALNGSALTSVTDAGAARLAGSGSQAFAAAALTDSSELDSGWADVAGLFTNRNLTASTAIFADANKSLQSSATTSTELGYVHGVTSGLQAQINALAPLTEVITNFPPGNLAASGQVLGWDGTHVLWTTGGGGTNFANLNATNGLTANTGAFTNSLTLAGNPVLTNLTGSGSAITSLTAANITPLTSALTIGGTGSTNVIVACQNFPQYNLTVTTNIYFGQPTGLVAGQRFSIWLKQDGTGGRTYNENATYWKSLGGFGTATAAAGAVDVWSCEVDPTGTYVLVSVGFNAH